MLPLRLSERWAWRGAPQTLSPLTLPALSGNPGLGGGGGLPRGGGRPRCLQFQAAPAFDSAPTVGGRSDPPGTTGVFWSPENSRLWFAAPSEPQKDQSLGARDLRSLRSVA